MSTMEVVHTLIEYNYALYGRLWQSIMTLDDAQFLQEFDYSHGSVRSQMVHAATVDGRWLRGLKGMADARQYNQDAAAFPTRERVKALWDATAKEVLAFSAGLSEIEAKRNPPGLPGPAWQVLAHMANHGTDHRAQVLNLLHQLGAPTFDQDLIMHLWFH